MAAQLSRENINNIIELLINKLSPVFIIIFGSAAKDMLREDSDIDVAVISPDFSGDIIEDQIFLMKYRRNIDLRIEPKPFRPEEFDSMNPFVREILNTGIEVQ